MSSRWMYGAYRRAVRINVPENRDQSSRSEIVADQKGSEPRDAISGERCIAQRLRICRRESTADRDRANLSVFAEPPFDRPAAMNER